MAAKYWIKLYHEILHERKMVQLDDRLWRRAIECFLFAGEENEGGVLPEIEDMAFTLRCSVETLETDLVELGRRGIVEQRAGGWFVTNFAKRQAKMNKAEYMRRLREERQREQYQGTNEVINELPDSYQPVTNSNADTDTDKIRIDTDKTSRNGGDIFTQTAVKSLVDWWVSVVGCGKPIDARDKLYGPAETLLSRLGQDVTEAKRLIKDKRGWMITDKGWTPKWLSGVVPSIMADLDKPGLVEAADDWGSDAKVYYEQT